MHIKIFNDAQWATAKAALAAAGHDLEADAVSETAKLVAAATAKYPALVTAFKIGFADVESSDLKGLAKMEKVVDDILPQVPAIAAELADLPNLKDFLVQAGQTLFTDGLADLEAEAKKLVDAVL